MGTVKKIYLDHCVLSNLAGDEPQDWRKTIMGEVLASGIDKGEAEVWASPTRVLETLLCAEYDAKGDVVAGKKTAKRTRIAQTLLELCEGRILPRVVATTWSEFGMSTRANNYEN
jgi:hypothetical protein